MAVSTEFCVEGLAGYLQPDILLFGPDDVRELLAGASGCVPVDPPRFEVSKSTLKDNVPFEEALGELERMYAGVQRDWSRYPQVAVHHEGRSWTSYQVALRKLEPARP